MIYTFDEYELDTGTFELRRRGSVVHLEPQVYGVLAHLVEHRDRVVSKIELLDEVWPDRFVSESALTSRIQAARKACGDNGRDQAVIRTRHGRGYRFVAEVAEERPTTSPREPILRERAPSHLVGRDHEVRLVDTATAEMLEGERRFVVITGGPGVGKTTVVDAVLEGTDSTPDLRVIRVQCRPHRGVAEPYVSLLDALARFGRDHRDHVVPSMVRAAPMWLAQLPSLTDDEQLAELAPRLLGGTHERMLREGVDLIEDLARRSPLVLVIEDLHWADLPTIELLEWLAGSPDDAPILVLVTLRPGEAPNGDADDAAAAIGRRPTARALTLEPFDLDAIRQLAIDRLDAESIDESLVRVLADRTGGNPLFVSEQLDLWRRDGSVETTDGAVTPADGTEQLARRVPAGVLDLIEKNLERLDEPDLSALRAAAVVGRDFPAFLVAAALDSPLESVELRLSSLARRGRFIAAVGDDAWPDGTVSTVFQLTHDLHHEVLYDRTPTSRRASMHQAVGERLEQAYAHRSDEHAVDLGRHFLASGDAARAVHYLQTAGEQALSRSAHAEAVRSLEDALRLLGNTPTSRERDLIEINLRASLGPALIATMGWLPERVAQNYTKALELCATSDPPPERFIVRYGLASVHELRGEYDRSEELLHEQLHDGPGLGVETQELLACSTFHQGAFERSLDHAMAGLEQWDPLEHSHYLARYGEHPGVSCNTWGALSAWQLGRPAQSIALAEQAVEWGAKNEYALATAQIQYSFLHQFRDEPGRCRHWAEQTAGLAEVQGFPFRVAQARILEGWCTAAEGRPADSTGDLAEAIAHYRTFGARMDEPYFLGLLADAALRGDRPDEALARLEEAAHVMAETSRSFFYEPELDRLRAVALHQQGRTAEAESFLDRAAATAARRGAVPFQLRCLVTRSAQGLDVDRDLLASLVGAAADESDPPPDYRRARALLTGEDER